MGTEAKGEVLVFYPDPARNREGLRGGLDPAPAPPARRPRFKRARRAVAPASPATPLGTSHDIACECVNCAGKRKWPQYYTVIVRERYRLEKPKDDGRIFGRRRLWGSFECILEYLAPAPPLARKISSGEAQDARLTILDGGRHSSVLRAGCEGPCEGGMKQPHRRFCLACEHAARKELAADGHPDKEAIEAWLAGEEWGVVAE